MSDPRRAADNCDSIDQTTLLLTSLFRRAAVPVIGSILLSGCGGGDAATTHHNESALRAGPMNCVSNLWRPMSALALVEQVEYAATQTNVADAHPRIAVRDAAGTPCASATDPRLCAAEMRRVALLETEPNRAHLLTTAGDTVRAYTTLEQKLALLGAIDTPNEALLLVDHAGYPVGCQQAAESEGTQASVHGDGYRILTRTPDLCGNERTQYTIDVTRSGVLTVVEAQALKPSGCTVGRRPPNLCGLQKPAGILRSMGAYFARAARLEAASVAAFEQLGEELRLHGAPRALRELARRSAEDEVRHARATAALAERFGARPAALQLTRRRLRDRGEVAADNAIEGCVQETFGAYVATVQAGLTSDPALKRALTRIAADETRHAALSWHLAAWYEPRLDGRSQRLVRAARRRALSSIGAFSAFG